MNFFSSDEYLSTLAETWFPGRRWEIRVHALAGRAFRLLAIEGHGPVVTDGLTPGAYHYLDFFEPLDAPPPPGAPAVRWLPRVALETEVLPTGAGEATPVPHGDPAPYVDWARFRDAAAFQAHVGARRASLVGDSRRKRKKLETRLGPLRFERDDRGAEAFDAALAWKSAQYVQTHRRDLLARPENVRMFRALRDRGLLVVSSLRAGDRLVAVHLGVEWGRRFSTWIPAYDRELLAFSPGRLQLEHLLEESRRRGDMQFDFLSGDEAFKYHYATHRRLVGPLGEAPLRESLRRAARAGVKRALALYPPLLERARALESRWSSAATRSGPGAAR